MATNIHYLMQGTGAGSTPTLELPREEEWYLNVSANFKNNASVQLEVLDDGKWSALGSPVTEECSVFMLVPAGRVRATAKDGSHWHVCLSKSPIAKEDIFYV